MSVDAWVEKIDRALFGAEDDYLPGEAMSDTEWRRLKAIVAAIQADAHLHGKCAGWIEAAEYLRNYMTEDLFAMVVDEGKRRYGKEEA